MALLSFLRNGHHPIEAIYINHRTEHAKHAQEFVFDYCTEHRITFRLYAIAASKPKEKSWEEHWRDERYRILGATGITIATGHNLNDVAETWLFSTIHGRPKIIPYRRDNVVRPLLLASRQEILAWNTRYNVPFVTDPSNSDIHHPRNRIRHCMFEQALHINPGYLSVVRRLTKMALATKEPNVLRPVSS